MSNKKPLVSVCIPAYNHEKHVTDCIKSIIAQTYKNIEILIIDDGSHDNTTKKILKLIPEMEKRFSFVFFQTQKNEGTCRTINKLYDKAHGKYIYHIASDDVAKPKAIETLVKFLESNHEYALVVGDNEIIDSRGKRTFWDTERNNVYKKTNAAYYTFGDFLKSQNKHVDFNSDQFGSYSTLFNCNYIPNGYLIRREIFDKTGPFTTDAPLEDWWFMLQISKYAKMKYIDQILFSYRWHGANTITRVEYMNNIYNKTAHYEWEKLKHSDFSEMLPDVKKVFKHKMHREFIHKYIYHRYRNGNLVKFKLFGFIKISYHKKGS